MVFEKLNKIFLCVLLVLLCSCENKEQPVLSLEGEGREYSVDGGACEVFLNEFIANDSWYSYINYNDGSGWVNLSETEGGCGKFAIRAFVKSNESCSPRRAVVTVRSGMCKIEYHIEQAGKAVVPDKPLEPDPVNPEGGSVESKYSLVSKIIIRSYNESFQLVGVKSYDFTYDEGKIVSAVEKGENVVNKVNVEYSPDRLVVADGVAMVSQIRDGYLETIESLPLNYISNEIAIGDWNIRFSDNGIESVANSKGKVSVVYDSNSRFKDVANIDLGALVCVSLLRGVLAKDFVYLQKSLYKVVVSSPVCFHKAILKDDLYLYDCLLDNGNVVTINEYYQPKYDKNWLKRSVEIYYCQNKGK